MKEAAKRIYVIVAETIETPDKGRVVQPCGRVAAQCAHAVSKMRLQYYIAGLQVGEIRDYPITTIVLAAPSNRELVRLASTIPVDHTRFRDQNEAVYGPGAFLTALCTNPIHTEELEDSLAHLPLWEHGRSLGARDIGHGV